VLPGVATTSLQKTILGELEKAAESAAPQGQTRGGIDTTNAQTRQQAARALGLALGSPEFQRK
jgi:hypothetical protein